MPGATSATVLAALLAAGVAICGVVVAAGRFARETQPDPIVALAPPAIRLLGGAQPTVVQLAHERGLPAFELRRAADAGTYDSLAALRPDVAAVACFPLRIPPALLGLPRHGFLNMHPSLLPRHRGPEPLFWTFRAGEASTGVTIHRMDEQFDTGDIVLQAPVELPDGIGGPAAERLCADLGGELMAKALGQLRAGTLVGRPQPPGGSYEPQPRTDDWRLSTAWPARRAFNFMRGVAEWGEPYVVRAGGSDLVLAAALGYEPAGVLGAPFVISGGEVRVQFTPGILRARFTSQEA